MIHTRAIGMKASTHASPQVAQAAASSHQVAVMAEKAKEGLKDQDARLLANLSEEQRDLVARVKAQHPKLTTEEALQALREAGM
jgi:hypothetical protein